MHLLTNLLFMESNFVQITRITSTQLTNMAQFASALEKQAVVHQIAQLNWPEFSYRPKVSFRIGHTNDRIVLKFYVEEEAVRAVETRINGEVYKDSCVEFFVSLDGVHYYNFEFSCIGTPHVAYGEGRHNRQLLPEEILRKIQVESTLGNEPFETKTGGFAWELTTVIPVECFIHNPELKLEGLSAKANFYKCGDELPTPHFVTWNPVGTSQPDYHRPEYFGKIEFEK